MFSQASSPRAVVGRRTFWFNGSRALAKSHGGNPLDVFIGCFGRPVFVGTAAHRALNDISACVEQKKARSGGNICIGGAILHGTRTE